MNYPHLMKMCTKSGATKLLKNGKMNRTIQYCSVSIPFKHEPIFKEKRSPPDELMQQHHVPQSVQSSVLMNNKLKKKQR